MHENRAGTAVRPRLMQSEHRHPFGVLDLHTIEQCRDVRQVAGRENHQFGEFLVLGEHVLRLGDGLTEQPASPQHQTVLLQRTPLDDLADLLHHELRVPGLGEDLPDHRGHLRREHVGDLTVEIGGDAVAHIRLDEHLEPGRGGGRRVVRVERLAIGLHRRVDLRSALGEGGMERLEMAHLRSCHACERDPAAQGRGEPGVLGEPVERRDLAVREHGEQLRHTGMIGGDCGLFRRPAGLCCGRRLFGSHDDEA